MSLRQGSQIEVIHDLVTTFFLSLRDWPLAVEAVPFTSASKYAYDIANVVERLQKWTCAKRVRLCKTYKQACIITCELNVIYMQKALQTKTKQPQGIQKTCLISKAVIVHDRA